MQVTRVFVCFYLLRSNVLAAKTSLLTCFYAFYMLLALTRAVSFHKSPKFLWEFTLRKDNTWQTFLQEVQHVTCTIGAVKIVAQGGCE